MDTAADEEGGAREAMGLGARADMISRFVDGGVGEVEGASVDLA